MVVKRVSWRAYKDLIEQHLDGNAGPRICRGHADTHWKLITSLHRLKPDVILAEYFKSLPIIADRVCTIDKRQINIDDFYQKASFLAYIQHHGFPTPLLDWTASPYIAAYFAFSDPRLELSETEECAIYIFKHKEYENDWKQIFDHDDPQAHVSTLSPRIDGNLRQFYQQGLVYMFANVADIETHIINLEKNKNKIYLEKFIFSFSEKRLVMRDLETMNINAFSLFGNIDGLCRYMKESYYREILAPTIKTKAVVAKQPSPIPTPGTLLADILNPRKN